MNKKFRDITNHIMRRKQGLRDPQIMHPEREWLIGILLVAFIFGSSALFSVHTYVRNRNITAEDFSEVQQETPVYRESMVKEALARLSKRDDTLQSLLSTQAEPARDEITEATTTEEVMIDEEQDSGIPEVEALVEEGVMSIGEE